MRQGIYWVVQQLLPSQGRLLCGVSWRVKRYGPSQYGYESFVTEILLLRHQLEQLTKQTVTTGTGGFFCLKGQLTSLDQQSHLFWSMVDIPKYSASSTKVTPLSNLEEFSKTCVFFPKSYFQHFISFGTIPPPR